MAQLTAQHVADLAKRLSSVASASKTLDVSSPPEWEHDYSRRPTEITMRAPLLSSSGVLFQGLFLCGLAFPRYRDANLTFTLEYFPHGGTEKYTIGKIAWRSHVIHYNGGHGPDEHRGIPMFNYFANYTLNKHLDPRILREQQLPIAAPMNDFGSINELLTFAGKALKVNKMTVIPSPWDPAFSLTS